MLLSYFETEAKRKRIHIFCRVLSEVEQPGILPAPTFIVDLGSTDQLLSGLLGAELSEVKARGHGLPHAPCPVDRWLDSSDIGIYPGAPSGDSMPGLHGIQGHRDSGQGTRPHRHEVLSTFYLIRPTWAPLPYGWHTVPGHTSCPTVGVMEQTPPRGHAPACLLCLNCHFQNLIPLSSNCPTTI